MNTQHPMTKAAAVALFGSREALELALGVTASAVSQWPDPLPLRIADRVRGAYVRVLGTVPETAA